jgi:hypothetical protein
MSIYSKLSKSVTTYYQSLQEQYSIKYLREMFIGMVILVCFGGGYFLNKFYVQRREQQAFVALSEVIDSFMQSQHAAQALDPVKDKEKIIQAWLDTQLLLDALYKEHISSYLAPYFLVFKSQIVLERDKNLDQAIEIMDLALQNISKKTELGSFYHLKRIKMGFDSKDQTAKDQALNNLIALSQDSGSYAYQEALYLLGSYFTSVGQIDKADEAFKKLAASHDPDALIKSLWVNLAQEKLGQSVTADAE